MKKVLALVVAAAMGLSSAAFAAETATPAKTAAPAKTTQNTQHHKKQHKKTVEQKAQAAKKHQKKGGKAPVKTNYSTGCVSRNMLRRAPAPVFTALNCSGLAPPSGRAKKCLATALSSFLSCLFYAPLLPRISIFPECSYLILLPLSYRHVYSSTEGLLLIIIITHQSVICIKPLLYYWA